MRYVTLKNILQECLSRHASAGFLEKTMVNILSFDGGGSRGIMEVMILDDIMNSVTAIKNKPKSLLKLRQKCGSIFATKQNRQEFKSLLSIEMEPVHPTEVFDLIAGNQNMAPDKV